MQEAQASQGRRAVVEYLDRQVQQELALLAQLDRRAQGARVRLARLERDLQAERDQQGHLAFPDQPGPQALRVLPGAQASPALLALDPQAQQAHKV